MFIQWQPILINKLRMYSICYGCTSVSISVSCRVWHLCHSSVIFESTWRMVYDGCCFRCIRYKVTTIIIIPFILCITSIVDE